MPTMLRYLTLKITLLFFLFASVFVIGEEGEVVADELKLDKSREDAQKRNSTKF
jgi:hypothetical protein